MYRNIHYTLDRGHPLQIPCGVEGFEFRLWLVLAVAPKHLTRRRGRGNVGILKGFPKSVGRVESRLYGLPPFPCSVISMGCRGSGIRM